jgi:protein-S-isoprenylcysteine O-methyltransferase Ste14
MVAFFWFIQFAIDYTANAFSWQIIFLNTALFMIFPLQHSILVRPQIKERIQKIVPRLMERSIYVGTSGIAMLIVLCGWQRYGPMLYHLETSWPIDVVFYVALFSIPLALHNLNHNSMFGLTQGYVLLKGSEMPAEDLTSTGLYKHVRHPLTSLLIVTLWAHASMTAGRLQWNLLFTAYALVGTFFEERDLIRKYGQSYLEYRNRVPAFIPGFKL